MKNELVVNETLAIPLDDIELRAVRSQGAGGQNVNKLATAIHLRFDYRNCAVLTDEIVTRLTELGDRRVSAQGIVIKAQEYRTQQRNRDAALRRLKSLLLAALEIPAERQPTRVPRAVKKRRLTEKRRRGERKSLRGPIRDE